MNAKVGEKAPAFGAKALVGTKIGKVELKDYKGKWVVLFFWPKDFTFVCPTEVRKFNELYGEFKKLNAEVIGASVDSAETHKKWAQEVLGKMQFPMLADTKKKISAGYGILDRKKKLSLRGTFIIDDNGILQHSTVNSMNVGRNVHETLRILGALQTGDLCQVEWKPGQKTIGRK